MIRKASEVNQSVSLFVNMSGGWRGGRGRGGWRGSGSRGGGGRNFHGGDDQDHGGGRGGRNSDGGRGGRNSDGGRGGRERPPPGLKGREIGMWYASRSRGRGKREEQAPVLSMNSSQMKNVSTVLGKLDISEVTSKTGAVTSDEPSQSRLNVNTSSYKKNDDWKTRLSTSTCNQEFAEKNEKFKKEIDCFSDPDGWMDWCTEDRKKQEEIKDENQIKQSKSFNDHIENMNDSAFKRSYIENVHANQLRETSGFASIKTDGGCGLERDTNLDKMFKEELEIQQNKPQFIRMLEGRKRLPSYQMQDEILQTIRDNRVVVISGETGCGKTTQVAQFILEDCIKKGNGSLCRIVCTQPRRISAISVAHRVADERAEKLGKSVGYQIRLESTISRDCGSILYCTTGIVLQWLQSDPNLKEVSHLILDEIHERDMLSDFLICIGRDLLKVCPGLKLILMSATLNAEEFSMYYNNAPMLHIPGFTFPVKEYYLEDAIEMTRFCFPEKSKVPIWVRHKEKNSVQEFEEMIGPHARNLMKSGDYSSHTINELFKQSTEEINKEFVVEIIRHIAKMPEGAVLVFLPGWSQISDIHKLIQNDRVLSGRNHLVIPLHSMMPTANQREVFDRPPKGVRKIVLATNIAETSITIDDIVYVIDCGKIKMKHYDKDTNLQTLLPEWVTLANARQRKGRAGRVQAGICYHLFSYAREMTLDEYPLPEMLRTRLEEIILYIKILKLGLAKPFLMKVLQPPDESVIETSIKMLHCIGALDNAENLTPLGFHLAQLPVDPLLGRMLLMGAIFSCVSPILTIAATLSFKHPFVTPIGKEQLVDEIKRKLSRGSKSDHLMFAYAYQGWEEACQYREGNSYAWRHFLSASVLNQLKNMRKQFLGYLHEKKFVNTTNPEAEEINCNSSNTALVRAIITSGLYPNVARVQTNLKNNTNRNQKFSRPCKVRTEMESKGVALHPASVNEKERVFECCWLMYREKVKSTKIYIHDTTMVSNYPLLFFGQNLSYCEKDGVIKIDKFVKVKCEKNVATLVQNLRNELDKLLEYKISHPGMTKWNKGSKEGAVLQTIVDLISSENISNQDTYEDESLDYDDY